MDRSHVAAGLLVAALACSATAQVIDHRHGRWSDGPGHPTDTFVAVRWAVPWTHQQASDFAASLGARLASLPTAQSLTLATQLSAEPTFWQCAGPWVGPVREPSQPWRWESGEPIDPSAWASGRPAQAPGIPACLLLAGEGEPLGGLSDAIDADFGQPVTTSAILRWTDPIDCDGNELPDSFEIALDGSLDTNADGMLDRCDVRSPDLDANGEVDFGDVAMVMLDFGSCAGCPSDLDWSGVVDFGDVAIVMLSFGTTGLTR